MSAQRCPPISFTSYLPLPSEYRPVTGASSARQVFGAVCVGIVVTVAVYAALKGKKPAQRPAAAPQTPDADRARREQAALIEEARRNAAITREVIKQNPAKARASW